MSEWSEDLYAHLNLEMDATPEQIRQSYRQLVRQYHPDMQGREAGTSLLFRQVQEAYEVLSDPERRAAYDRQQIESGRSPQAAFHWNFQFSRSVLPAIETEQTLYIMFDIASGAAQSIERLPLNICLLLDRSTSMQGARLHQTKIAAHHMIDSLTSDDTLSIITFSDRAEVIWPGQRMTDSIRAKAKVSAIQASGGTEILQGLTVGLGELEKHRRDRSINHLIMLTDGQTYGDEEQCLALSIQAKQHKIGISALGIGEDWNDSLLDAIATRSGGVSQYIAAAGEIQSFLSERVQGLGSIYGDNLRMTLKTTEGTKLQNAFTLLPYIQRIPSENGNLLLGTLQADKSISGILEITIGPHNTTGTHRLAQIELTADIPAQNKTGERLHRDLIFSFAAESDLSNVTPPANILSALAKITIFRMQEGAWQALEKGDVTQATQRLETMATRLLDLGEPQLARAALLEAGRLSRSGNTTSLGRKTIKYGTRSLSALPVKEKKND